MSDLPPNYYHCFLGNGLDAVLIGATGAMDRLRAQGNLDRCAWYKSDRYYPEEKLVRVAAWRFPWDRPLEHAQGSGWFELAPLARAWYELLWYDLRLDVRASRQHFVPQEATLYSEVDYGPVRARVATFLHASLPLLVLRYELQPEVRLRAWLAPGPWIEEGYDTDPFRQVETDSEHTCLRYRLADCAGLMAMRLEPAPTEHGHEGRALWLETSAPVITQYVAVVDDKDGPLEESLVDRAVARGYDDLRREHLARWREFFARSRFQIPSPAFQRLYDSSQHLFKAVQNPVSGGLPVNNLRLTWSSHVFWDAYYLQRALLEANHLPEALEACRFLQRTLEHARRHAAEDFGAPGLKWDWEITHDGRPAYGAWTHQKEQVHNNASYANMIWQYYEFTRDRDFLAEFFPILRGLAEFFLAAVIEKETEGYGVRSLVGVHESPERVKNEGYNLSGAIRLLEIAARAAEVLGREEGFAGRWREVAQGLRLTLDRLFNGRYFTSAEGVDHMNLASLAPGYPMEVLDRHDPRLERTARAYLARHEGRPIGHGGSEHGFPWAAAILATLFARLGDGDTAWSILQRTEDAICLHGGMSESVLEDGRWNMQYFGTAQGAACTAMHHLVLQADGDRLLAFPAVPVAWERCEFERLLAAGLEVSGVFDRRGGQVEIEVRNVTGADLERELVFAGRGERVRLAAGGSYGLSWSLS